jgi:hypothetical protein
VQDDVAFAHMSFTKEAQMSPEGAYFTATNSTPSPPLLKYEGSYPETKPYG